MSSVDHGGDDGEAYESVASKIVLAVVEQEGIDPAKLEPSLYDVVDPEALEALFAPTRTGRTRTGGRVTFTYCGYDVTTYSDGRVHLQDPSDPTTSASPGQDPIYED